MLGSQPVSRTASLFGRPTQPQVRSWLGLDVGKIRPSVNTEAGTGIVLNGYKVVFVPFSGGKPSGMAQDVVTGFLNGDNQARGRLAGVASDKSGALLIADDVGNAVGRVTTAKLQMTEHWWTSSGRIVAPAMRRLPLGRRGVRPSASK